MQQSLSLAKKSKKFSSKSSRKGTVAELSQIFARPRVFRNVETKAVDLTTNSTVNYAGAIQTLTLCAQGNDWNQRSGNSIRCQALQIGLTAVVAAGNRAYRYIVFADMEQRGTTPAVTDVLEYTSSPYAVISPYNHIFAHRFVILHDQLVAHIDSTVGQATAFDFALSYDGHIRYIGTTAAAASNGEGSIYFLIIGDNVTSDVTYAITTRTFFIDN